jgi:hypothetical protein
MNIFVKEKKLIGIAIEGLDVKYQPIIKIFWS